MINKLYDIWPRLIGTSTDFSLESRIFHSISVAVIILGSLYIPYNIFSGMYIASASFLAMCLVFFYEYYNSRYKNRRHSSLVFGTFGLILFSLNFFANSGIDGSTDIIWPAFLLFLLVISPYRQHLLWVTIYILVFFGLHLVAYHYPELVQHPFTAGKGELIDRLVIFPLPAISIYLVIKYIRKNYDRERLIAENRSTVLEMQKRQIEKSDAEKNKLLSIMSHDMRAPMVSIQGYLQLLGDQELDRDDRTMIEKDLLVATNSTMDMLTNLLQWSKSQMGGSTVNLNVLNLQQILQKTLEMCKMQAAKKSINLNYIIPADMNVIADADMLQLVIRNLVSNAIKFTPANGFIHVTAVTNTQECLITVSDNGRGIEPEKQQKLFSVNTSPDYGTNNEKGVGLGLNLCKEFIELQNGRITFNSMAGKGSDFFVFVPMG